jgi:hypothetical protein
MILNRSMGSSHTIGRDLIRLATSIMLMVLSLVALAGCGGGGSQPFAKGDGTSGPSGKTVPPIALAEVIGLPASKLAQLKDALAISAGKRDMAIIDGILDKTTLSLRGNFQVIPDSTAVRLNYNWTLTDQTGNTLHSIAAEEIAPGSPAGDPWAQVTPAVIQRVAAYTAESLSSRLSQLGYATEVGGLPPPIETYARAGPDADKDIDYETLNGPMAPPSAATATSLATESATAPATADNPDESRMAVAIRKPASVPVDTSGRKQISAVVVLPVKGAPGSGNDDLTRAMRQTLEEAGWPVLVKPRDDALTISGRVKLGPQQAKSQDVALAWTVMTPDGRRLGIVRQKNVVTPGSLKDGWGDSAFLAAQAAATGIYDLIKKYR